jgi:membrane protein
MPAGSSETGFAAVAAVAPRLGSAASFLCRLAVKSGRDKITGAAAAIAFFSLLAAFPGLGVVISIYGLVVRPGEIEHHLMVAAGLLPDSVIKLVAADIAKFTHFQRHHYGLSLGVSLALTLTSGHAVLATLIAALNTIYGRVDTRRAFRQLGLRLVLTFATLIFVALAFALAAVAPVLVHSLPIAAGWRHAIDWVRWPVLALMMIASLSRLYRHAPHRGPVVASGFGLGAGVATLLWLALSLAYSFYVTYVDAYDIVYGSVGAAVTLLIWLYLSSIAVLLGAEIDTLTAPKNPEEKPHG